MSAAKYRLKPEEREVVCVYNDADRIWRIYSDSRTWRSRILRLAQKLGVVVHHVGDHGAVEFEVPADALRLAARKRPSNKRTEHLRRLAADRRQRMIQDPSQKSISSRTEVI